MTGKKAISIAALLCFIMTLFFLFFWGENRDLNLARSDFVKEKYEQAKYRLNEARQVITPAEYFLYSAYILREQNKLKDSSSFLVKAAAENQKQPGAHHLEIALNQILNAYLEHNLKAMENGLAGIKQEETNNWVKFFQALVYYAKHDYKEACAIWKKVENRDPLSAWMENAFQKQFPPFWVAVHIVRCEIEEGDYLDARQTLQKDIQTSSGEQLNDLYFLLGLSYAKEAQPKPPGAAIPYYKLAFSYFDKIPINEDRFFYEKQQVIFEIQQKALKLIEAKSFKDLAYYINILEQWKATQELNDLTARLIEVLNVEISEKDWSAVDQLTAMLNQVLPKGQLRDSLGVQFEKLVADALEEGNFSRIMLYWKNAMLFSANSDALRKQYSDLAAQKIIKLISTDAPELTTTIPYIEFWKNIEEDHQRHYQFALELIAIGNYLWANEHEGKKALALILAAAKLPYYNEQKLLKPFLEKNFKQLYTITLQEDSVDQLEYILKAIDLFHLETIPVHDLLQQGNQLEDAQFLYHQKRYAEAEKKARWVLLVNPSNETAIKLVGLLDYQKGNYSEALLLLKKLQSKDSEIEEAIAISEILAGNKAEGLRQLKKREGSSASMTDAYLRIGYGMLVKGEPRSSLEWFDKVIPKNDEVYAGEAYARYENHQWQQALDLYHQLAPPYSKIFALQGIAIESLVELGEISLAEEILNNMLKQDEQPSDTEFPLAFLPFKTQLLDPIQRETIAGRFYLNVKKDKKRALAFYSQVSSPSTETLLAKAEVMLSLGDIAQALANMELAAKKSEGQGNAEIIRKKSLPLMAGIYVQMGYLPESAQLFKQFFLIEPANMTYRPIYASTWMKLGRYDLALKEYILLEKAGLLDPDDQLNLIESLVHLNSFEEANRRSKDWLENNPPPSLTNQLKLARFMIITKNSVVFTQILQKIPDFNRRTLEENRTMINLWIDLGEYEKATALALRILNDLEQTPEGLMTLARLNMQLSNTAKALEYANQALKINPYYPEAQELINQNETDPAWLKKHFEELKKKREADPNSLTLKMEMAAFLTHLPKQDRTAQELTAALVLMQEAARQVQDYPRVFVLLGNAYLLLDNALDASQILSAAVKLNVSDVEAYQLLALAYNSLQEPSKASASALEALKYAPNDAEAWREAAYINEKNGNHIDAINFLLNAIKFKPNDSLSYLSLAHLYYEVKNIEGAQKILETALHISPNNIELLKFLNEILSDPQLMLEEDKAGSIEEKRKQIQERIKQLEANTTN